MLRGKERKNETRIQRVQFNSSHDHGTVVLMGSSRFDLAVQVGCCDGCSYCDDDGTLSAGAVANGPPKVPMSCTIFSRAVMLFVTVSRQY